MRTKRRAPVSLDGCACFLTFSCEGRLPLLASDATRDIFIESLAAARRRHAFDLWAYVVMPEHVHLLLRPAPGTLVAPLLAGIKRPVSHRARRAGRCHLRRFWLAGGGHVRVLGTPAALLPTVGYIHGNPVRRGLCERPEDWRYGSAAFWLGRQEVPLAMDGTLPPLEGSVEGVRPYAGPYAPMRWAQYSERFARAQRRALRAR